MLSMAAGAWQGTTAQTEQAASPSHSGTAAAPSAVVLRGCIQKGQTAGTFLLMATAAPTDAGLDPASAPVVQEQAEAAAPAPGSKAALPTIPYELVSGKPDVDLTSLVGKRVEARGTPERTARGASADDSPSAAASAADSPTAAPAGTMGHTSQRSRIRVSTIRPVTGSCE